MKPRHQIKFGKQRTSLGPKVKTVPKATLTQATDGDEECDVVRNQVTIGERQLHFARALSDTEKHVREASLRSLQEWLTSHGEAMSGDELQRLWKALFYCIWMADKRAVITAVTRNIVDLYDYIGWPYLETLFTCMMREWFGIDRHRVDKYYELISTALTKALSTFIDSETFAEFSDGLDLFLELLCDRIWQPSRKSGVGLALHILDVYLDRVVKPILKTAASKHQCNSHKLVRLFNRLTDDVFTMAGARNGWLPSLNRRIHERILARLVELVSDDDLNLTPAAQTQIIDRAASEAFNVASDEHTEVDARKRLYEIHSEFKGFIHEMKLAMPEQSEEAAGENENDSQDKKDEEEDGDDESTENEKVKKASMGVDNEDNDAEEEDSQRIKRAEKSTDEDKEDGKSKDAKRSKSKKLKRRKSDNQKKRSTKNNPDNRTAPDHGNPKGSKRSAVIEPAGEARIPKKWKRQKKQGSGPA